MICPTGCIVQASSSISSAPESLMLGTATVPLWLLASSLSAIVARLFVSRDIPSTVCCSIRSMYLERSISSRRSDASGFGLPNFRCDSSST